MLVIDPLRLVRGFDFSVIRIRLGYRASLRNPKSNWTKAVAADLLRAMIAAEFISLGLTNEAGRNIYRNCS